MCNVSTFHILIHTRLSHFWGVSHHNSLCLVCPHFVFHLSPQNDHTNKEYKHGKPRLNVMIENLASTLWFAADCIDVGLLISSYCNCVRGWASLSKSVLVFLLFWSSRSVVMWWCSCFLVLLCGCIKHFTLSWFVLVRITSFSPVGSLLISLLLCFAYWFQLGFVMMPAFPYIVVLVHKAFYTITVIVGETYIFFIWVAIYLFVTVLLLIGSS